MKQICALMMLALATPALATPALAQTPQGSGPPSWSMGYRIDLGLWHGLKLDGSDNLDVTVLRVARAGAAGPAAR